MDYENVNMGMYPTLMGMFNLPPPNLHANNASLIHSISIVSMNSIQKVSQFKTSYFNAPWKFPKPSNEVGCIQMNSALYAAKIAYKS